MRPVFADTSFYAALLNPSDALHERAKAMAALVVRIVTTEFILVEVANFFTRQGSRPAFVRLLRQLPAAPGVTVLPASADLFARGAELFAARPDKEWSLTDCTSFVVMQDRGLTDALTADRHFAQAGFRPLLA